MTCKEKYSLGYDFLSWWHKIMAHRWHIAVIKSFALESQPLHCDTVAVDWDDLSLHMLSLCLSSDESVAYCLGLHQQPRNLLGRFSGPSGAGGCGVNWIDTKLPLAHQSAAGHQRGGIRSLWVQATGSVSHAPICSPSVKKGLGYENCSSGLRHCQKIIEFAPHILYF